MVKLEMEKSGEPMNPSETPTQLGVSVPMGGKPTFAASRMDGSNAQKNGQCNALSTSVLLPGGRYKAGTRSAGESTRR